LKRSWWGALAPMAAIVILLGGCGNSGPANNATPAVTNLFPSNITAGSDGFTLAVTATGILSSNSRGVTFAYWNGSPRSTSFNETTNQLQVTILASDLTLPGSPQLTLWNPPPGGGLSEALTFTIEPVATNSPTITSISPTSATAGAADVPLTVTGTNFLAGDVITLADVPLTTSISGNQATATIPANDIASVSIGSVAVSTPGLVVASPSVAFPITAGNNPSPSLSSLSPSTVVAGSSDFEVMVGGGGFAPNSTAEWNGMPIATAVLSGSKLVVLIPGSLVASAGTADVTVTNPAPGGGTSSSVTFTIKAQ
jgi:hypothetical protein